MEGSFLEGCHHYWACFPVIHGNGGICKPAWWVQPGWQHDGRVQSSGKEITDFLPEGGNFVTGASTQSVAEMTQGVDTDTHFPEFGSLAEWSIAGVSRGKVKMSHWWNPKYCSQFSHGNSWGFLLNISSLWIGLTLCRSDHKIKSHCDSKPTYTSKLLSMFPRDNTEGFAGDRASVEAHLGHKRDVTLKLKWQFNP